jgi:hypothetical protein
MLKHFTIGIVGPMSGLTVFQIDEIKNAIKETQIYAQLVVLQVWRDSKGRHNAGNGPDSMIEMADLITYSFDAARLQVMWVEYESEPAGLSWTNMKVCDSLFFCPGHAHTSTQKSRVHKLRRYADSVAIRHRVIYAWRNQTCRP